MLFTITSVVRFFPVNRATSLIDIFAINLHHVECLIAQREPSIAYLHLHEVVHTCPPPCRDWAHWASPATKGTVPGWISPYSARCSLVSSWTGLSKYVLNVETNSILLPRPFARNARSRSAASSTDLQSYSPIQGRICPERCEEKSKVAAKPFFHWLRLPRAHSCSCLSVYQCHSAVMAAFVSFHAWHSVPGRQFAPNWTACSLVYN